VLNIYNSKRHSAVVHYDVFRRLGLESRVVEPTESSYRKLRKM